MYLKHHFDVIASVGYVETFVGGTQEDGNIPFHPILVGTFTLPHLRVLLNGNVLTLKRRAQLTLLTCRYLEIINSAQRRRRRHCLTWERVPKATGSTGETTGGGELIRFCDR